MPPQWIDPRACLLRTRDTALQRDLESAELIENVGRAPKDRPLDTGEFGTDVAAGLAWAGGSHPTPEDRLGPIELLVGADNRDDLDGAVALGERLPEAAAGRTFWISAPTVGLRSAK